MSKVKLNALFLLMQSVPNKFSDPCMTRAREVNRINRVGKPISGLEAGEQQKKMEKKKKKREGNSIEGLLLDAKTGNQKGSWTIMYAELSLSLEGTIELKFGIQW